MLAEAVDLKDAVCMHAGHSEKYPNLYRIFSVVLKVMTLYVCVAFCVRQV